MRSFGSLRSLRMTGREGICSLLAFPLGGRCRRSRRKRGVGPSSILHSTFYILHLQMRSFDSVAALPRSGWQRGGSLRSLGRNDREGRLPCTLGWQGRFFWRCPQFYILHFTFTIQNASANNFILNFCQTIAKRQNSWYHSTARAMQWSFFAFFVGFF